MKTITVFISIVLFSVGVQAQSAMDKLYDKYSGIEGYTTVYISKYMFDMFRSIEEEGDEMDEMNHVISNLDCIKILVKDDDQPSQGGVNLYGEMMKQLPSVAYNEVMVVKDGDENINMYVREEKGKVVELLMVIGGDDEDALISIQGIIDMKNISKLAKTMNIEGMENLEMIEEQ